jgi:hypothetical protein
MFLDRETLQTIRETAKKQSNATPNPYWISAYDELALVADRLDAMLARCEIHPENTIDDELGDISAKIKERRKQ